jgi:hypothetical protein
LDDKGAVNRNSASADDATFRDRPQTTACRDSLRFSYVRAILIMLRRPLGSCFVAEAKLILLCC